VFPAPHNSDVLCLPAHTRWIANGQLYSAGSPQYGQLGDGSDHSYNAKDCECAPSLLHLHARTLPRIVSVRPLRCTCMRVRLTGCALPIMEWATTLRQDLAAEDHNMHDCSAKGYELVPSMLTCMPLCVP